MFTCFDEAPSVDINIARIKFLRKLNLNFKQKTVLETGMGARGDISQFLHEQGADLFCFDARQVNCDEFNKRHPGIAKVFCIDFDQPNSLQEIGQSKFDGIVCLGTLYHLTEPAQALDEMAKHTDNLILTTCISTTGEWNFVSEQAHVVNQSFHARGCRPGVEFLRSELLKRFEDVQQHTIDHKEFERGQRTAFVCTGSKIIL